MGFTLIEVLFVVAIIAITMTAIYPYIGRAHTSWQMIDRRSEVIQNARIGMDKMIRVLREATGFTSVTKSNSTNGKLVFLDKVGDTKQFKKYSSGGGDSMLGYVEDGITSALAGPITALTFICYEEDGVTETSIGDDIRSIEIVLVCADGEEVISDQTVTSRVFYRND